MTKEQMKRTVDSYAPQNDFEREKLESVVEAYGEAPKLDLSKIQNMKAAKESGFNSQLEEKTEKKSNKKSKFSFTEEHEFNLPTRGYLYQSSEDDDIRSGIIRLRPMTLKDEEILANQTYIKNGSVFRRLIDSCMLNDFDAKELTGYDTYFIIYALREITYGKDYKFQIKCGDCGKEFEYELKMNEAEFDELEEKIKPEKTIKLPVSKYTVTIKYPSIGDEEAANKFQEDGGDVAKSYAVRTIAITDNEGEPVSPRDFVEFYEAIPGKDRVELSKAFEKLDKLKVPTVKVVCPKCGEEMEMDIPFNRDFFRY